MTAWIPHDGGECPVPGDAVLEIMFVGSRAAPNVYYAKNIGWSAVSKYRVLRPGTEPEREREIVLWVNVCGYSVDDHSLHNSKTDADAYAAKYSLSDRIARKRVVIKWRPGEFDGEPT